MEYVLKSGDFYLINSSPVKRVTTEIKSATIFTLDEIRNIMPADNYSLQIEDYNEPIVKDVKLFKVKPLIEKEILVEPIKYINSTIVNNKTYYYWYNDMFDGLTENINEATIISENQVVCPDSYELLESKTEIEVKEFFTIPVITDNWIKFIEQKPFISGNYFYKGENGFCGYGFYDVVSNEWKFDNKKIDKISVDTLKWLIDE